MTASQCNGRIWPDGRRCRNRTKSVHPVQPEVAVCPTHGGVAPK